MKGGAVDNGLRLVQIFLSQTKNPGPGIYEVSINNNDDTLHCTCPGYRGRASCKHVRFVQSRIEHNNGTYPLEISDRATSEDAELARTSNKAFREFVVKFGRIEVY